MSALGQRKSFQLILILILVGLSIGCNQTAQDATVVPLTVDTPVLPTAPPPVTLENGERATRQPDNELPTTKFTLRVWLTTDINALPTTLGGDLLAAQLELFDDNHPDVELDVQVKSVAEQGGSLNYLRTGSAVAPNAMPDLIVLPSSQLQVAYDDGLLYPLDGLVDTTGLYTAARTLGTIDGGLFGYPFALDQLQHFAYNGNVIIDEFPNNWSALIARDNAALIFAASGEQGAALALQLYHAQGGALLDGEDRFTFQRIPLVAALEQIRDGVNTGVLQETSNGLVSAENAWQTFQSGEANITMVETSQLLTKRAGGNTSLFGSIPGPNDPSTPIVQGWLYSITTADPTRQVLSAELISWLTEPENLAPWSETTNRLPPDPVALNSWGADPYINYVKSILPMAQAYPKKLDSTAQNALSTAVVSILTNLTPAEEAADFVLQTLSP